MHCGAGAGVTKVAEAVSKGCTVDGAGEGWSKDCAGSRTPVRAVVGSELLASVRGRIGPSSASTLPKKESITSGQMIV